MVKFEFTQIGEFHINYNEDFLASHEIGNDKMMIAVIDGCTMGIESHFTSTLIGKLLRQISKEIHYKAFIEKQEMNIQQLLKEILRQLFAKLKKIKNQLGLEQNELLSTLILGMVNIKNRSAEIITIGDGLVFYNDHFIEYDQDDMPDYLGYHLHEEFEDWFCNQNQRLSLTDIDNLSISTDGIFSFKEFDNKKYKEVEEIELLHFLLKNENKKEAGNRLKQKVLFIEKEWGLKPSDDLTVISLLF